MRNFAEIKKEFKALNLETGTYVVDRIGTSISLNGGYQVSFEQADKPMTNTELNIVANLLASQFKPYIGVWGEETEISFHVKDLNTAMDIGRSYNQKAIWDWANKKEIWL